MNPNKDVSNDLKTIAKAGYDAYGKFRSWQTHDGKPMPQWEELTMVIQEAWAIAAREIILASRKIFP